MKLALRQIKRIAISLALSVVGIGFGAPSPARADVYFYKDPSGVLRFTRTAVPGAKVLRAELLEDGSRWQVPTLRSGAVPPAVIAPAARLRGAVGNTTYDHIIVDAANRYGVDAALVKAIIHAESGFQPRARSRAGARGLMQVMPRTAGMYGVPRRDLSEPSANIRAGVRHLRSLLETFAGNVRLAVGAYNAGAGAVQRHGGLPPFRETQAYVRKVLRFHALYAEEMTVALGDSRDGNETGSPS